MCHTSMPVHYTNLKHNTASPSSLLESLRYKQIPTNDLYSNLKFTIECDTKRVHYLDMWIEKSNGTLFTTLYRKETDINTILQGDTFHPEPLKRGLPRGQFFRLCRICHSTEDYLEKAAEMPNRFLVRGNSPQCVDEALNLALGKT